MYVIVHSHEPNVEFGFIEKYRCPALIDFNQIFTHAGMIGVWCILRLLRCALHVHLSYGTVQCRVIVYMYTCIRNTKKTDILHLCTCFTVLAFDGSPCEGADDLLVDLGVSTKNCYRSELVVVDWSVVRHSSNLHLRLTFVYNENDSLTGQNIVGFYSYVFR